MHLKKQYPASPQNLGVSTGNVSSAQGSSEYNTNIMHHPRLSMSSGTGPPQGPPIPGVGVGVGANQVGSISGSSSTPGCHTNNNTSSSSSSGSIGASLVHKSIQTDLTGLRLAENEAQASADVESRNTRIDELNRSGEELRHQMAAQQRVLDQQKAHNQKCIEVIKKLLIEKSTIERKDARQRCMQNRLKLGQFVTQRVGATFQENWTDGYAFQELTRYFYLALFNCVGFMCFIPFMIGVLCIRFPGDKKRSQMKRMK